MHDKPNLDFLKSPHWLEYEELMKEKKKYIKHGSNVIHFEYFGSFISEEEILEIEQSINCQNLQLSRFDKEGVMYASMDDFQLATYILIAQPVIQDLMKSIGTNTVWEVIKGVVINIWKKTKSKKVTTMTSSKQTSKQLTFGVKVKLDKNTSFNFKLEGDIDEKTINSSLDKTFDFLREQKINKNFKHADMVYVDKNTGNWFKVDTEKELRKRLKKNK